MTSNEIEIRIGNRRIGSRFPALIIGEVAQAHDGSLGTAHAFIDAIADAGADAVKFQTHIAEAESTPGEVFRVQFSKQDKTRRDYWRRMEFSAEQWNGLAVHATQRGLIFLSSPFSIEAVDMLERVGMPAWKIASGEVTHFPMLERMAVSGKPFLLSAGMSNWEELDRVVAFVKDLGVDLALFQCTTAYPTQPHEVGLNIMATMRERYGVPVGLSDHSGRPYPGMAAVTLGANMIEVHVTLSRQMFGPDVAASLTPAELKEMVDGIRFIEQMQNSPVDKDGQATQLIDLRKQFFHSVVANQDLPKGTILERKFLSTKKPGSGIPAERVGELVGKKLTRDVSKDQVLVEEDFSE